MIYCANCGNGLQDDVLFCPECGTKAEKADKTVPEMPANENPSPPPISTAANKPKPVEKLVAPVAETPQTPRQFCRNCGNEVAAGAFACLKCGLPPLKAFNFCPSCGANCHQDAVICIKCGVKLESQGAQPLPKSATEPQKVFCRNCGKVVLKDAVACLNCGLPPSKSKNFCPSCGSETHNEAVICVKCGTALEKFVTDNNPQKSTGTTARVSGNQPNNVVVVGTQKSVGTAFLLAFLFGPLGLLYASVVGGIIMFFASIILFFLIPVVGGILAWIGCIIWAVTAAQNSNESAINKANNIVGNLNK